MSSLQKGRKLNILLIPVIARRFVPKQSRVAEGIASLRFTPLAMTMPDYWFLE